MGSFTRLYLTAQPAPFTPTNYRGAWSDPGGVTQALEPYKIQLNDALTEVIRGEVSASNTWSVALYRGVSGPISAQTFSGTINVVAAVDVSNFTNTDFVWHVHAYVTVGDTDTVRGTLLNDYIETLANEWPLTPMGHALAAAQSVGAVAAQDGDRIVVELGYRALNTFTSGRNGSIWYGVEEALEDLVDGGNFERPGFIEFSVAVTTPDDIPIRNSQLAVEAINAGSEGIRISQLAAETVLGNPQILRLSQLAVEAPSGRTQPTRMSQFCVEVITENIVPPVQHLNVFVAT